MVPITKINGVDLTASVMWIDGGGSPPTFVEEVFPGVATATIVIWDEGCAISIARWATVEMQYSGASDHVFQGFVTHVHEDYKDYLQDSAGPIRILTLTCVDYNIVPDNCVVGWNGSWSQDGNGNWAFTDLYASTSEDFDAATAAEMVRIYTSAWGTFDTTSYVQNTSRVAPPVYYWPPSTLKQALDELAAMGGQYVNWWFDQEKAFHFGPVVASPSTAVPSTPTAIAPVAGSTGNGPGSLSRMIPESDVSYVAPYSLTDVNPDGVTSLWVNDLEIERDYTAYKDSLYSRGGRGITPKSVQPGPPPYVDGVDYGGSWWVKDNIGQWQGIIDLPGALTTTERDAIGSNALARLGAGVVRCKGTVYGYQGFHAGQAVPFTNYAAGIAGVSYPITRVHTTWLNGIALVDLEWGDAPVGTIGQRRRSQATKTPQGGMATQHVLSVDSVVPDPGKTVRVVSHAADAFGNPVATAGLTVNWSVTIYDTSGNDVTASTTDYTLIPASSVTDPTGSAYTDLTASMTKGLIYIMQADTP